MIESHSPYLLSLSFHRLCSVLDSFSLSLSLSLSFWFRSRTPTSSRLSFSLWKFVLYTGVFHNLCKSFFLLDSGFVQTRV